VYVTSFYSFKGGVGRTLALVNVAFELASRGRRVLVVDFDLEAPGISTFSAFADCAQSPGLVDYVTAFVASDSAPNVRDYVYRCGSGCGNGGPSNGELWVMPAGKQDAGYGARLGQIDWADLYANHQGFLMFEDLKAQWNSEVQPDYVLIDSRTGHTDAGGICTRQLPDAVVLLFFPNEQNITGLRGIVGAIREEKEDEPVVLHFVPSRVPDLDDENGTLEQWLERAMKELGYPRAAATIHQYDSMDLLSQAVFTVSRPKSRLAREYRALTDAVVAENLEDRDGALASLERFSRSYSLHDPNAAAAARPRSIERALETIAQHHPSDGEILYSLGVLRERQGNADAALLTLEKAITVGNTSPRVFFARARAHRLRGNARLAGADLITVLESGATPSNITLRVIQAVCDIAPERISAGFEDLPSVAKLSTEDLASAIQDMLVSAGAADVVDALANRCIGDANADARARDAARSTLALSYISRGRFSDAHRILCVAPEGEKWIADHFNLAIADWGLHGRPDESLFSKVVDIHRRAPRSRAGPNFFQAISMALHVCGQSTDARSALERSKTALLANPTSEFSAWRYLEVRPGDFLEDLQSMREWMSTGRGGPEFLTRARRLHAG
jgi:MinD-like ATPase involved in chromosome partitioning or flagellar assembly